MNILEFMTTNPWQTFFLGPFVIILFWMTLVAFAGTLKILFKTTNRVLRTIKVALRGWPPAHLDADGDFKPVSETLDQK